MTSTTEPGRVFTRAQVIDRAFGFDHLVLERTVDAHVMNLRRKIEDNANDPRYVQTVFGRGYRLAAPTAPDPPTAPPPDPPTARPPGLALPSDRSA